MSIRDDLEQNLRTLHASRAAMPTVLQLSDPQGLALRLDLTQVDSMSCELTELALFAPQLQQAAFTVLEQWASELTQRVSYLLEKIGPIEFDPANGQVLIRSTPPNPRPAGTQYYEILLTSVGNGSFTLRRFQFVAGQPGRTPAAMQMTHEVLLRLVEDLIDSIPAIP